MKRMAIEELADKVEVLMKVAPKEKVLLTRAGQPFAFVSDASKYDWEDIGYMTDPEFWKMIRERRKERGGIPLEVIEAELEQRELTESRKASAPACITGSTRPSKKSTQREVFTAAASGCWLTTIAMNPIRTWTVPRK